VGPTPARLRSGSNLVVKFQLARSATASNALDLIQEGNLVWRTQFYKVRRRAGGFKFSTCCRFVAYHQGTPSAAMARLLVRAGTRCSTCAARACPSLLGCPATLSELAGCRLFEESKIPRSPSHSIVEPLREWSFRDVVEDRLAESPDSSHGVAARRRSLVYRLHWTLMGSGISRLRLVSTGVNLLRWKRLQ